MAKSSVSSVCPARIHELVWLEATRSEPRTSTARLPFGLNALTRYCDSGQGDIKALGGERVGYSRLRVGAYRIFAATPGEIAIGLGVAPTSVDELIANRSNSSGSRMPGFGIKRDSR